MAGLSINFPKVDNLNFGLFRAGVIYVLKDPDTHIVRYVGKTFSPTKRFYEHTHYNRNIKRNRKNNWVKSLNDVGKSPIIEIIDECDEFNWNKKEKDFIKLYKACGAVLVNSTDGGEGCRTNIPHEDSVKRVISIKMQVLVKTETHNLNVSNALKLKNATDKEFREKTKKVSILNLSKITPEKAALRAERIRQGHARTPSDKKKICTKAIQLINKGGITRYQIAESLGISYGVLKDILKDREKWQDSV